MSNSHDSLHHLRVRMLLRVRNRLQSLALLQSVNMSPWYTLYHRGSDPDFTNVASLSRKSFHILLREFNHFYSALFAHFGRLPVSSVSQRSGIREESEAVSTNNQRSAPLECVATRYPLPTETSHPPLASQPTVLQIFAFSSLKFCDPECSYATCPARGASEYWSRL